MTFFRHPLDLLMSKGKVDGLTATHLTSFVALKSGSSLLNETRNERTRTITIAFADAPSHGDGFYQTRDDLSSESSTSLLTPSTHVTAQSLLDQLDHQKEKEKYFGYHPIWRQMSMSDGIKLRTLEYFWEAKIFQLFNFLMTHLLAHTPEDPEPFLVSLLDRCIRYRDEDGDPPLVFEESHINSVYTALDPLDEGSISYRQYLTGMQTLGLSEFNVMPDDMDFNQNVAKDSFIKEAKDASMRQLDMILGKGRNLSEDVENVVEYERKTLTRGDSKAAERTNVDGNRKG